MTQRACWLLPLYRLLVGLYPPGFRAQFAAEMQQVFAALITEAAPHGQPPLRLCLREFGGVVIGVVREWLAVLQRRVGRFPVPPLRQPVTPAPWWEVLLTIFPGLCIVVSGWYLFFIQTSHTDFWLPGFFGVVLTCLFHGWLLFMALRWMVRQRLDPATLLLVSILAALLISKGMISIVAALRMIVGDSVPLDVIILWSFLLIATIIGGVAARRHGAHALIMVLIVTFIFLIWMFDPFYGLDSGSASTWLVPFITTLPSLGWFVLAPLALLRARTIGAQMLASSIPVVATSWTVVLTTPHLPELTHLDTPERQLWQVAIVLLLGSLLALVSWCYALIGNLASRTNAPHEPERYV